MDAKGRRKGQPPYAKGEKATNARLTNAEVKRIRKDYATGKFTQKDLGEKYHCTSTNICMIVNRKSRV